MAQTINPIFQIGKNGVGDNLALELHELVKISVLRNAEANTKDVLDEVCQKTGAEPVTAIGNKIVIYKRSTRDDVEHIQI